jgi:hypothetical protein
MCTIATIEHSLSLGYWHHVQPLLITIQLVCSYGSAVRQDKVWQEEECCTISPLLDQVYNDLYLILLLNPLVLRFIQSF